MENYLAYEVHGIAESPHPDGTAIELRPDYRAQTWGLYGQLSDGTWQFLASYPTRHQAETVMRRIVGARVALLPVRNHVKALAQRVDAFCESQEINGFDATNGYRVASRELEALELLSNLLEYVAGRSDKVEIVWAEAVFHVTELTAQIVNELESEVQADAA